MKTRNLRRQCLPTLASFLSACFSATMAQPAPPTAAPIPAESDSLLDPDLELLGKAAKRFVEAFNQKDAAAIAALFTPHAELVSSSGETYSGREAIEAHYAAVFAAETAPLVSLEADSVRLVAPGVVVEDGMIHFTQAAGEPVTSVAYSATHRKQPDGGWLIATNRDQPEVTPPVERLKPLHWLVGEWTLEGDDGLRVDMVLDLDDSGNYLLGESLVTDAEGDSQSTHLRIGWNPATTSIYWWTFDSQGGFTSGPWARNGDDWTIASTGFTADAETNSTSQTLTQVRQDSMVWTARSRLLAGETLPDVTFRFVRRAPDPGSVEREPEAAAADTDAEADEAAQENE
ncbi:SgcJ/EcaC family oxidoreductase [bacterium]|nr:SgcJ/EcaC family oxidoreductase [bacterium]